MDVLSLMTDLGSWYFQQMSSRLQSRTVDQAAFDYRMAKLAKKQEVLEKRIKMRTKDGYAWLNVKPNRRRVSLNSTANEYRLKGFSTCLATFLGQETPIPTPHEDDFDADIWYQCRIQRGTVQNEEELADSRTIQAVPCTVRKKRHGLHNCVLIKVDEQADDIGLEGELDFIPLISY